MTTALRGTKDDGAKAPLDMIYPKFLEQLAFVLKEGEETYGVNNWRELKMSRILAAMMRHTNAINAGEWLDPKSNRPHVAHIAAGAMFLDWIAHHVKPGQDDRRFALEQEPSPDPYEEEIATIIAISAAEGDGDADEPTAGWGKPPALLRRAMDPLPEVQEYTHDGHTTLAMLQSEVVTWADAAIGPRTYKDSITKMVMEELPELLLDPESPLEFGDVAILLLDLAHLAKIDITEAVRSKLAINRKRKWARDEKTGLIHHVEDGT